MRIFKRNVESTSIIDDLKVVLLSKSIMVILAITTLVRVLSHLFLLPNTPSEFGPDEGTYAALAKFVSQGLPVEEFPLYGAGLYNASKSITLPSAFFVRLGVNELSAVRAIASIYGLGSSLVLVLSFLALSRLHNNNFQKFSPIFDRKFLSLLFIFNFLPSNFVWSIIGLRESGSQFWLITTFYLILKLLASAGKDSWKFTLLTSLTLTLAHGTRPSTALVFSLVALLTSIVLLFVYRRFFLTVAILIGIFAGQAYTATPKVLPKESLSAFRVVKQESIPNAALNPVQSNQSAAPNPVQSNQSAALNPVQSNQSAALNPVQSNQSAAPNPVQSNQSAAPNPVEIIKSQKNESASAKCNQENKIIQFEGQEFMCVVDKTYQVIERNPAKTLEQQISIARNLDFKRDVNALDAKSALPNSTCQNVSRDIFNLLKCNLSELPYRLFAFLFRPFIFLDSGSPTLTFAALENLGWIILVPLSLWVSLRNRQNNLDRFINLSLTSYVLLFASAAALYEGNLGTAFRHKSTILWPLIFILMNMPKISPESCRRIKNFLGISFYPEKPND